MLTFVTTCHAAYTKPWIFPTLDKLSCRVYALLDPQDKRVLPVNVERIDFRSDRFYQDGRFLDPVPGLKPEDVVMLADADAVIQRNFSAAERELLDDLGDAVAVGYNMRPGQTGAQELEILRLRVPIEEVSKTLEIPARTLQDMPMYNWGLVAAKVSTWHLLRKLYAAATRKGNPQDLFVHPTYMQYLLCALLAHYQIPVLELGYETHSHNHFGMKDGHSGRGRSLYYRDELVFFAHFMPELAG